MMMTTLLLLALLLAYAAAAASSTKGSSVVNPNHRYIQEESELDISFDGDIEAIKNLALAKAADASSADEDASPRYVCEGETEEYVHILSWDYSIEYLPGSNEQEIVEEIEEILRIALRPRVLSCLNDLAISGSIVSEDKLPVDELSDGTWRNRCRLGI